MKTFTRDFLTGLTGLVGLVGLALMLFLFGEFDAFKTRVYTFTLHVDTGGGLLPSSVVTINGVRSGTLKSISNAANPAKGVELVVKLNAEALLPDRFDVFIDRSLIGDAVLELTPVPGQVIATPADLVQQGEVFERTAKTTLGQLAARIEGPLEALSRSAVKFDQIATTYNEVGLRVTALLEPRTAAEVDAGAAATIPSAIARIDTAVANADGWLGDAELRAGARDVVAKASALVDRAGETADRWRDAAGTVDQQAALAGQRIDEATAELSTTLRAVGRTATEVEAMAGAVNAGKGTLGQLLTNPDLYRSMQDAAQRLDRALTEAQLLIEKFRKEGVPVQF